MFWGMDFDWVNCPRLWTSIWCCETTSLLGEPIKLFFSATPAEVPRTATLIGLGGFACSCVTFIRGLRKILGPLRVTGAEFFEDILASILTLVFALCRGDT
jgi:hypothetical protein